LTKFELSDVVRPGGGTDVERNTEPANPSVLRTLMSCKVDALCRRLIWVGAWIAKSTTLTGIEMG
jgi:hypothetical protein